MNIFPNTSVKQNARWQRLDLEDDYILHKNQGIKMSKAVNLKFHVFYISVSKLDLCSLICIKWKFTSEFHLSGETVSPVRLLQVS